MPLLFCYGLWEKDADRARCFGSGAAWQLSKPPRSSAAEGGSESGQEAMAGKAKIQNVDFRYILFLHNVDFKCIFVFKNVDAGTVSAIQ